MPWICRVRALFRRKALAQEQEEELRFHLSMREEWNVEQGMPRAEARRAARLRFGNLSLWREQMSEVDLMILPQTILQDLRYGARMLCRNAGFTIVAVSALAVGIGINTAVLTAYKAFFALSLDARDPGKMVNLALVRHSGATDPYFSYPDYEAYRDGLHSFSGLIAVRNAELLTFSGAGGVVSERSSSAGSLVGRLGLLPGSASNAEFAATSAVSENYFSVLGVAALRGRTFKAEDTSSLAAFPEVLISENYWQKRFGRDPALLGKTIRLNGTAFTIVGITPHDFVGTSGFLVPDFWLPLSLEPLVHPSDNLLHDRENQCCRLFARLGPGVNLTQAQAEMTLLAGRLRTLHDPHSELGKPASALLWPGSPFPIPLKQYGGLRFAILLIMAAAGMVLVIACANVAGLQLARAASRQNELSMRLSLGASRLRLVRQLLTESALLGLLAGVVALLFTWALLDALVALFSANIPAEFGTIVYQMTPDLGVFAYVFAISLVAGVLFGLAPALETSHSALSSALKAKAVTSPFRSRRLRDFLIAAQVAVALVLMIAGSLLIRSSLHLLKMDPGYNIKQVVDLDLQFPEGPKYTADRKVALVRELRTRLYAVPGVIAVTTARAPLGDGLRYAAVSLHTDNASAQTGRGLVEYDYVQPNYFQTLGIPLLFGRGFRSQAGQPEPSVIVSESTAKQFWPGQNPIGRTLRLGTDGQFHGKNEVLPDGPAYQVTGIARNTRGLNLDGSDTVQVYLPLPEDRLQDYPILIRTTSDPTQVIGALGSVISSVDPDLVAHADTLAEIFRLTPTFAIPSTAAAIASTVGLFGLLLASMGIYGTISYVVVLRTREVGIRIALGAGKQDILGLMLRESTRPVLAGLLVGMCLAVGASYLLRRVLYGLNTVDGISFAGISIL
ncbi:MAG TPA: ABC transporter permease, partial [Acidobacteriaceae bacterium]|nr:ABC transporter permease [Acidobacteriaceae bacterium]